MLSRYVRDGELFLGRPQRRLHQLVSDSTPRQIIPMVKDDPTTRYIYPEFRDIGQSRKRLRPASRHHAQGYIGTPRA